MEKFEISIYTESKYGKKLIHVFTVNTEPEIRRLLTTIKLKRGYVVKYVRVDKQYFLC